MSKIEANNTTFTEKLIKSISEFSGFEKDSKNPFFKSNYMSLDLINSIITPVLCKNGLYVSSRIEDGYLITKVTDGITFESSSWLLSNAVKPQDRGAEITYAKRYNISALLNLSVDIDDDGNSATGTIGSKEPESTKKEETKVDVSKAVDTCLEKLKENPQNEKAEQQIKFIQDHGDEEQKQKLQVMSEDFSEL